MTNETRADVAIIGAGFSGLSAARRLQQRGLTSVIVEARDRVGGRVYSQSLADGTLVELGGQWAGPTQHRLLTWIEKLGLSTFPTYTNGKNQLLIQGKESRYRGAIPRMGLSDLLRLGWIQFKLNYLARRIPLNQPWSAADAAKWDQVTLGNFLGKTGVSVGARAVIDAGLETIYAAPLSEVSLLHALFYIRSGEGLDMLLGTRGGAQEQKIHGGMQLVAQKMSEGLSIQFNSPVRKIEQSETGVLVRTDQSEYRARYAIVTIPPPLIPQIDFVPALPEEKRGLFRSLRMGSVIKCTAVYNEPFWRKRGLSGHSVSDEGPLHVTFDNSPANGSKGVLLGFAEANSAKSIAELSTDERKKIAIECFARRFGDEARDPIAYLDHVWEKDEWSGGGYGAYWPPGTWTRFGAFLRTPFERIHWAGTETATEWSGYIEGALQAGERAADEISIS